LLKDNDQRRHRDHSPVMSRRQVLSGATYGLGATLLFARPLADVTAKAAQQPGKGAAPSARGRDVGFESMRLSGDGQPRSVCKGRQGVVVVGADDQGRPISWMNEGDVQWHRRTLERPAAGEPEVWGVAAHGDQFVAVGSMLQHDAMTVTADGGMEGEDAQVTFTSSRRRPTIWWTYDSLTWNGRTLDDVDEPHAQLISVSCHTDLLVAVGSTLDADGVQGDGAFALTSDDGGVSWRRGHIAARDASLSEGSFTGVADVGGEWLATSTDLEGGALWTSPDGLHWSTIAGSARTFRGITLQGLDVHRGRVYLAGTTLTDHTPRYFASTDRCRTWQPLRPGPTVLRGGDTIVNDLTVMSGEVVVVGTQDGIPVIEGGAPDGDAD
jgi:hypothetical protein